MRAIEEKGRVQEMDISGRATFVAEKPFPAALRPGARDGKGKRCS